jgi:hypothetical protein
MVSPNILNPAGNDSGKSEDAPKGAATAASGSTRRNLLLPCLFIFGLASLSYLLGAAVIFFDLPSSSFLRRAFGGGVTWYEHQQAPPLIGELPPLSVGSIDKPDKTCDGFTLLMYGDTSRAVLVNMAGEVVHQWQAPFSTIWTAPPHLRGFIDDASVYYNDGHLYPNGDLLVVVEGPATLRNPSNGYGLVKLDKDAHVLWKYDANCHHDVTVSEDGTIYAIVNEVAQSVPAELEYIPTPCVVDVVDVISPDGKRIKRLPLLDAIKESPYAPLLGLLEGPPKPDGAASSGDHVSNFRNDLTRRDVLHTNAIKVLSRAQASKFPLFRAGQLLLSVRHLNALVVLDPDSGKIVWATRGPWQGQHDPWFLDNGHLLLFDNLGSPRGSRVLEFDPTTQAFPWSYPGEKGKPFLSRIRGMCQRLPNGNTLITNSDGGEVFEVTLEQEMVWSCSCGRVELNRARRYVREQVPFLKGAPRGQP